jgi:hypothetical protein
MNSAVAQTLITVPALTNYRVTKIIVHNPSVALDTASFSIGWTTPAWADMVTNAVHAALTVAGSYEIIVPKPGSIDGVAGATLKVLCNTLQGVAATCSFEVYGILA